MAPKWFDHWTTWAEQVRDRRRDRREGKMHKKGRRKNTNRKGKQRQII